MSEVTIQAQGMNVYEGRAWTIYPDGSVEFNEIDIYDQRDIDDWAAAIEAARSGRKSDTGNSPIVHAKGCLLHTGGTDAGE